MNTNSPTKFTFALLVTHMRLSL